MTLVKVLWTNLPYLRTKYAAFCNDFDIILPCKLNVCNWEILQPFINYLKFNL